MLSKGPVVKESFRFELDFCGLFLGVVFFTLHAGVDDTIGE